MSDVSTCAIPPFSVLESPIIKLKWFSVYLESSDINPKPKRVPIGVSVVSRYLSVKCPIRKSKEASPSNCRLSARPDIPAYNEEGPCICILIFPEGRCIMLRIRLLRWRKMRWVCFSLISAIHESTKNLPWVQWQRLLLMNGALERTWQE